MGGMDNDTSIGLAKLKARSKLFNIKRNEGLYEEYLNSNAQYLMSFVEWKKQKFKNKRKKKKKEKMQKPLTKKQLEERGYNAKLSLNYIRWK